MKLWKMHGAGNDFLVTDNREFLIGDKSAVAAKLCDRHFGVGADGFIALENSEICDIKMSFYNADGSEDTMCGNGIRCLAKFARDRGITDRTEFTVETGDGIKNIRVMKEEKRVSSIMVDMGGYSFSSEDIGIDCDGDEFIEQTVRMRDGTEFIMSCVRLGVNHGVIFVDDDRDYPGLYGREIENQPIFKRDMNVNFVRYIDESHIEVKTWERGVGKTLACGTGSSSSVLITSRLRKTAEAVHVRLPGGNMIIRIRDGRILMEGPAEKVADITVDD